MRHFMRAESMFRLLVVAVMLVLWSPSASGQAQGVLRIHVTLPDADGQPAAVAHHRLLISDNPATALPREVVTSRDGSAVVTLPPGNYTVESDTPFVVRGKAYAWWKMLDVPAGRETVIELTAADAEVETPRPESTVPDARAAAAHRLPRAMAGRGRRALDAGAARHRVPGGRARACCDQPARGRRRDDGGGAALAVAQGRRQGDDGRTRPRRGDPAYRSGRDGIRHTRVARMRGHGEPGAQEGAEGLRDRHAVAHAEGHIVWRARANRPTLARNRSRSRERHGWRSSLRGGRHAARPDVDRRRQR